MGSEIILSETNLLRNNCTKLTFDFQIIFILVVRKVINIVWPLITSTPISTNSFGIASNFPLFDNDTILSLTKMKKIL